MKKEHYIWLIFPLVWIFWAVFMKGHIAHWEETDFFQWNILYLKDYLLKPAGWSGLLGNFLLQFYRWNWLGALIQTLPVVLVFVLTRKIVYEWGIKRGRLLLGCVPCIFLFFLQCNVQMELGAALTVVFFYFLHWVYLSIHRAVIRYIVFSLLFPVCFLLLGGGACIPLYIVFMLYETGKEKLRERWVFILWWLLCLSIFPWIWRRWIYIIPMENLYTLVGSGGILLLGTYGYGILLAVIAYVESRSRKIKNVAVRPGEWVLIVAGWAAGTCILYDQKQEYFFRMDQAVVKGHWDEVIAMAGDKETFSREESYLLNLALVNKGILGECLFDYPVSGIGCLYLPREIDYRNSVLGGEMYYRLKIPNEAIHWIFQASVASPQGMNFRTLRRLIELNIMKGDSAIADKYLTVLEEAGTYGTWCREKRKELNSPDREIVLPADEHDFFIGGRPFLSDMARVMDAGRSKDMVLDYLLSGLLLSKDLNKFCRLFNMLFPQEGKRIPRAYQEALWLAVSTGNKAVAGKKYRIDPEVKKRHQHFMALLGTCGKDRKQAGEILKEFRNTCWYYFYIIENEPADTPRGMKSER